MQLNGFVGLCSVDSCLQPQRIACDPFLGTYANVVHGHPASLHGNKRGRDLGRSLKSV